MADEARNESISVGGSLNIGSVKNEPAARRGYLCTSGKRTVKTGTNLCYWSLSHTTFVVYMREGFVRVYKLKVVVDF